MGLEATLAEGAASVKTLGWSSLTKLVSLECGNGKSWRIRQDQQAGVLKGMPRTSTILGEQQVFEQGQVC